MTRRPACKHENADHLMPGEWFVPDEDSNVEIPPHPVSCEQFRCIDCGAWLSLGPSNDSPDEVRIEIDAAAMVADTDCDLETWHTGHASERCARCDVYRLAFEIVEHKESP